MQAQQAKSQQQAQEKAQEQQNKGSSSRCGPASATRRNCPTPLHALPSGRIGQLLIRRSGRVHLCLLTDIFRRRTAYAGAQTAGAAGEGAAEGNQGLEDCKNEDEDQKAEPRPTYTLRSDVSHAHLGNSMLSLYSISGGLRVRITFHGNPLA